jgi:hypothetical protein
MRTNRAFPVAIKLMTKSGAIGIRYDDVADNARKEAQLMKNAEQVDF